jgi:hypothetical protein
MREIFKAYSLSFLIHSLLLFGFFLLTQRLVPPEKRLIEIDLSLENVQRQPSRRPFPKSPTLARKTASDPASPTSNHSSYEGGNKKLNNGKNQSKKKG